MLHSEHNADEGGYKIKRLKSWRFFRQLPARLFNLLYHFFRSEITNMP